MLWVNSGTQQAAPEVESNTPQITRNALVSLPIVGEILLPSLGRAAISGEAPDSIPGIDGDTPHLLNPRRGASPPTLLHVIITAAMIRPEKD